MFAYNRLIKEQRTKVGTARSCRICHFTVVVRAGTLGQGRGYGLREGNKARGKLIQHLKANHPDEYAAEPAVAADPPGRGEDERRDEKTAGG